MAGNAYSRQYQRAAGLASVLEERLLHEQHHALAAGLPLSDLTWDAQRSRLSEVLYTLAYLVDPESVKRPSAAHVRAIPGALVGELRQREREGARPAQELLRAASHLSEGPRRLDEDDRRLLASLAQHAEAEAAIAHRHLVAD